MFYSRASPTLPLDKGAQLSLDRVRPPVYQVIKRSKCIHFVKQVKWNYLNMRSHVKLERGHICQIEIRKVYPWAGVLRHIEQKASLWLCRISIAVRDKALIRIVFKDVPRTGSVNTTTEYHPGILRSWEMYCLPFLKSGCEPSTDSFPHPNTKIQTKICYPSLATWNCILIQLPLYSNCTSLCDRAAHRLVQM